MSDLPRIRLLPETVINKIAAGEVVERPASVVKELVENSLDGGATRIEIAIAAGGRKLVSVTDDGCGMERDEALLAIERHATSKIRDVEDIERIATLGFRGEALAAIAAVSRFRLRTCREGDAAGTEVEIVGGIIRDVRDCGCPRGTCIEARDLFFNIPARRKFLRTHRTEQDHVRACFVTHALAHPAVGMTLRVDGEEAYRLPAGGGIEDRLADVFGPARPAALRRVEHCARGITVSGYVGLPSGHRADRDEQYVFVNGRPTSSAPIQFAIREGYRTLLPNDRFPCVFLFVALDPGMVDVNVHPAKREVRFHRPGDVRDTVIEAIRGALRVQAAGSAPTFFGDGASTGRGPETAAAERPRNPALADTPLRIDDLPAAPAFRYPRPPVGEPAPWEASAAPGGAVTGAGETAAPAAAPPFAGGAAPWTWCRVVGQVGGLYVILETEEGIVTMDPHAAHERVLFERFMNQVLAGAVESQTLLLPETVTLPPSDAIRLREQLDVLRDMGFGVAEFGRDTFVLDAVPACFGGTAAERLLPDISHALDRAGRRGAVGRWKEESIAQAACKAAVKARDRLSLAEIERLVGDLARTQMPYTCPHGRPTLIFTSFHDVNRKFGRE